MLKTFSRFLLTAFVALFSCAAFAEPDLLLYFQIDDSNLTFDNGEPCAYDIVTVSPTTDGVNPTDGSDYLQLYVDGGKTSLGDALSGGGPAYASLGSNPSPESQFLFELWNDTGRVGYYAALYSELAGHIMMNGMSTVTPLMITQVHAQAVPEPTSGLLTVLGVAFLALRRKRV